MMKKNKQYHCVATIAGSDPSGGAGIQGDIKTISALGCYAISIITALTAQNTQGVQGIQEIPPEFVQQQMDSVFTDISIDSVKIGMLHNTKIIDAVVAGLQKYQPRYIVLDPVMVSKNGSLLLQENTIAVLKEKLFPLVTLITPNLVEAEKLLGESIMTTADMEQAAKKLGRQFNINVLVKGGHLVSTQSSDVLYMKNEQHCEWLQADRIDTQQTHGTGCTLSSAIASFLALDYSLYDAVLNAKQYLTKAIEVGSEFQLGRGAGPVGHFF
ncbi:MAG: bifunctional hydroxymethylpyrimidine kinase/phosphomethylpyrimidine kinase [Gammaproteobacteria bacterium]